MPRNIRPIGFLDVNVCLATLFAVLVNVVEKVIGHPSNGLSVSLEHNGALIKWILGFISHIQSLSLLQNRYALRDTVRIRLIDVSCAGH